MIKRIALLTLLVAPLWLSAQVRTETSMDAQGMPRIDILIDELDNRLAARIGAGRSQTGRAIDMTRGTNRARGTY